MKFWEVGFRLLGISSSFECTENAMFCRRGCRWWSRGWRKQASIWPHQEGNPASDLERHWLASLFNLDCWHSTLKEPEEKAQPKKKKRHLDAFGGCCVLIAQACCRHFLFWPQWVLLMVRWQCDLGGQLQQVMTLVWNPWGLGNNLAAGARITAAHHKQLANCATPISLRYLS